MSSISGALKVLGLLLMLLILGLRVAPLPFRLFTSQSIVTSHIVPTRGDSTGTVLDDYVQGLNGTQHVPVSLNGGVEYNWLLNVTSGAVDITLTNGTFSFWLSDASAKGVWILDESGAVHFSTGGPSLFVWSPASTGTYEIVLKSLNWLPLTTSGNSTVFTDSLTHRTMVPSSIIIRVYELPRIVSILR